MVKNKKGRKQKNLFGTDGRYVDTWAEVDGEWKYIGKSKKRIAGVIRKGEYDYFRFAGNNLKQEA